MQVVFFFFVREGEAVMGYGLWVMVRVWEVGVGLVGVDVGVGVGVDEMGEGCWIQ
jgi:hypothetical protein